MICIARPKFHPVADAPVGHRIAVIEATVDPMPLHWTGELVGVDSQADGEACWLITDDSGLSLSLPYSQIADWEFDDARLIEED